MPPISQSGCTRGPPLTISVNRDDSYVHCHRDPVIRMIYNSGARRRVDPSRLDVRMSVIVDSGR